MMRMLIGKAFLQGLQYRAQLFLRWLGTATYYLTRVCLWIALLGSGSLGLRNPELLQMITYTMLTEMVGSMRLDRAGFMLGKRVLSGDIAMDLIKPYSLRTYLFCNAFGESCFRLLVQTLPLVLIVAFVFPPVLPASGQALALALLMAVLGLAVVFYIHYLFGLWCFWLKTDFYVDWIMGALATIFGGGLVPLWMYPAWLQTASRFLPFRYMYYEGIAVYLGQAGNPVQALLVQAAWLLGLILLEKIVWTRAQRRIYVLGG